MGEFRMKCVGGVVINFGTIPNLIMKKNHHYLQNDKKIRKQITKQKIPTTKRAKTLTQFELNTFERIAQILFHFHFI